ncbi:MAG: hypothetical protein PHU54_08435 [Candidatus Omnitrophica bacterium]|jgi:hypothetical protein|nr:hypothetical protein [Candidatus Omnitrophota bacterium]
MMEMITGVFAGICALTVLVNVGLLIVMMLIHRANQKMYTEYFKDRSIAARK